jgi:2'-5' RNA ligase
LIRLFAALAVPDEIAKPLALRQTGLAGARWHTAGDLHITLKFFGEVTGTIAEDLDLELAKVAARTADKPLDLSLSGVGAFSEGERFKAVWAGLGANEALQVLAARCEAGARRAGLAPDKRKYTPHVTLAYLKGADPAAVTTWLADHALLRSETFSPRQFGLYSSWRTPQGSRYTLERVYRF